MDVLVPGTGFQLTQIPHTGYRTHAPKVYRHHLKTYGHPSKFGYKDFIPMWKADKFNADSLATFYKEIGAKFIGVMAVHHDNFDLYDSSHQPWNSVNMGPKLDIVGAWQKACKKVGVHFAISSHLSNYCHEHMFYQGTGADPEGAYAGVPYDYMNPAYEGSTVNAPPTASCAWNPNSPSHGISEPKN